MLNRRLIFILGMHRSGTSALARAVHLQGATLPKTLMPPQKDNPEGFWESQPIVQFNNRLLQDAGLSWDDPRPINQTWWRQPTKHLNRIDQARQILMSEFPEGELLVLKDPRFSRLLPIWLEAARAENILSNVILCCRNPKEVAASLNKRNGIGEQHSNLLWLTHMLEAEHASRNLPRALLHYDELVTDWRNSLSRVYDAIGLDSLVYSGEDAEAIDKYLSKDKRHHLSATDQILRDEKTSPLLKETWTIFQTRPTPSARIFDNLRERFSSAWDTIGHDSENAFIQKAETNNMMTTKPANQNMVEHKSVQTHRHIILHYHLFKNAGTSLDHILKQNFKDGWYEHEGPGAGWRSNDVTEYLSLHPELVVLSSHTAILPVPSLPNATVYPIIFIRHPIDRIRSIYEFERNQIADTEGARMAKETDIAGYIKWRLHRKGDRAIRNFQAYRLAFAAPEIMAEKKLSEEERVMAALETLPFIGVVEQFNESLTRLQEWLRPAFPHIDFKPTRANVTQRGSTPLSERLEDLSRLIGEDLYAKLVDTNRLDMQIYEFLSQQVDIRMQKFDDIPS